MSVKKNKLGKKSIKKTLNSTFGSNIITEGKAKINIETRKIVSKDMPVFYNPVMELNRTVSVLLLKCIDNKDMQIGLPLEASGLRGIRFLKEISVSKIKFVYLNDYSPEAIKSMKENFKLNKLEKLVGKKIIVSQNDANLFLLESKGFDYIDIDPFGTPNPFLDSAVKRIARGGILAVTATDTAALSGTYPDACKRKYWATPLRTEIMHEIGLRILIRKCQLIGAQFDKALVPIFSYSDEHYMRVFFLCEKGKSIVDEIIDMHGMYCDDANCSDDNSSCNHDSDKCAGPMWLGRLWDEKLAVKMFSDYKKEFYNNGAISGKEKMTLNFLETVASESKIDSVGFYNLPAIAKKYKLGILPTQEKIISLVNSAGYNISKTHFAPNSVRSNISEKELVEIVKKLI